MNNLDPEEIYLAPRGSEFKELVHSLLTRGSIKPHYIDHLLSEIGMELYSQAFTAASANPEKNYEFFEQIGDLAANQFLVSYTYRKYPQLQCAQGVKIVARVRINYGSKEKFAELADKLEFWKFISATNKAREKSKKDLLEDTFEAFCGVTQWLLDSQIRIGVGYAILYSVLDSIYKEFVPISLRYEDLFDAKTRLKELFDRPDVKVELGDWTFASPERGPDDRLTTATLYIVPPPYRKKDEHNRRFWIPIAEGVAAKKINAEQNAAAKGICWMRSRGYWKEVPEEYTNLCASGV
jgi:dsRNA-specific ribonuclease